jgi:adenosylcobinamide-GDP ribazoletransferase
VVDGLRLAVGTFTAVRVPAPAVVDRRSVASALCWAPFLGGLVGGIAGTVLELVREGTRHSPTGPLLASSLAIATLALLTRGLHLDGLADTADGLGSRRPPADALAVMRRSDIGPFGVAALVLVLIVQVSATAESVGRGTGWLGLVVASAAGRAALAPACARGVPAARRDGLGSAFAGALPRWTAALVVAATTLGAAAVAVADDDRSWALSLRAGLAVLVAVAVGLLLVRFCVRRLGGVTGDVMGAVVEMSATAAMLCFALL